MPEYIDTTGSKQIGLWLDEENLEGDPIVEFCGLRAKTYAYKKAKGGGVQHNKGVRKAHLMLGTTKRKIKFEDFLDVLHNYKEIKVQQTVFAPVTGINKFGIKTFEQEKKALTSLDNKRYVCSDNINTLPWGSELIPNLDLPLFTKEPSTSAGLSKRS